MMKSEVRVDRSDYRRAEIVETETADLKDGEVLLALDKAGLTANNITYAVAGDLIGYWKYFPAPDPYGFVPLWGYADVVASKSAEIAEGERLWGFWPMASHVTLQPSRVKDGWFDDGAAHRAELPALYNRYYRTQAEPAALRALEDERCILYPLFATSYVLYDWLIDNAFFGAEQILIGSASSKTGFGLAGLLNDMDGERPDVIGLTSPRNLDFTTGLGFYDRVLPYADITSLDASKKSGLVDMSGSDTVISAVHEHFGENTVLSSIVGATHWEDRAGLGKLPGAKPSMFFAPGQIGKRDKEWGPGVMMERALEAWMRQAEKTKDHMTFKTVTGAEDIRAAYLEMVDGATPPNVGVLLDFKS